MKTSLVWLNFLSLLPGTLRSRQLAGKINRRARSRWLRRFPQGTSRPRRVYRRDEDLNELEPLLSFFASFVLELPVVQEIMRWDMAVLRESPWYQQILQEGRQEGRQEGELQLVLRLLNRRFGALNATLEQQIRGLSVEQLETLAEELLEFSTVEELETWLEQQ